MNVEPQELPAEALAMLVENPGSSLVAQLLQHVAHQEQTIVSLRAELAAAREIAHSNLCCTAKIQGELDAERARVDALTALLRETHRHLSEAYWDAAVGAEAYPPAVELQLRRVDQALASTGAEKSLGHDPPSLVAVTGKCRCGLGVDKVQHAQFNYAVAADPSPGASERRTTARCALENSVLWALLSQRPSPCGQASVIAAEYGDWHIRVCNAIRDVIAAGDDNG
jgi:hypothetical protein